MYSNIEFSMHTVFAVVVLIIQRYSFRIRRLLGSAISPPTYTEGVDLSGQIVVITGANAGIGRATATKLVSCGATVILGCRDIQKGIEAAQQINSDVRALSDLKTPYATKGNASFMRLDLSDLNSVLEFSHRLKAEYPRVDILVNNAGLNMQGMLSCGIEQLFHVNYLGHYLLLRCLQKHLSTKENGAPGVARVVNLSSVMHHTGQPNFVASATGSFSTLMKAKSSYYADSKLYMHYLTMEINRRFDLAKVYSLSLGQNSYSSFDNEAGAGAKATAIRPIVSISVNPGAVRSDIWRDYPFKTLYNYIMKLVFLEVDEGCSTSVFAATIQLNKLREYQESLVATEDTGGRFLMRPDVPYVVPYRVRNGFLAQEILGVYEGCEFGGVTLPSEYEVDCMGLTQAVGMEQGSKLPSQQARKLWAYSADLCHNILLKQGAKDTDIKFLLE